MDHHHRHSPAATDGEAPMAELLDLDAEVLHSYQAEVTSLIAELTSGQPVRRIVDLGSGTGAGTLALLRRFERAEATALDMSEYFLGHLMDKARDLGLADRVRTVRADLDTGWPALDEADLIWASLSLHHLADPDRILTEVLTRLRPGGVLAVAEMDSSPRFLPDDIGLGLPGLEKRCQAVLDTARAEEMPHIGSDWGPRLVGAGFTVEAERRFVIDLAAPLPPAAGRYAQASLERIRSHLGDRLSPDDLATLGILVDSERPEGVLRRGDLNVRAARNVWVARRPLAG